MALALFAQSLGGIPHLVILAIVVAAVIGIGLVVARASGIVVPGWVAQIGWIVLACVIGVVAIRFLMGLT